MHWALVLLFPLAWWTEETDHIDWHKDCGFAIAALLVFRVFWGFCGSWTSRFSSFVRGLRAARKYVRGECSETVGHNPLGGWNVLAMLALLAAMSVLGLFSIDADAFEAGPLAGLLSFDQARFATRWHGYLFDSLLVLIALHITSVLLYFASGRDLITPMLTGRRWLSPRIDAPYPARPWAFWAGMILAAGTFLLLWWIDSRT
jgi:cytochrome b